MEDTLTPVLESASFIASNSKHVSINEAGVKSTASKLLKAMEKGEFSLATWKQDPMNLNPKQANDAAVDWIFVIDTLNFCFWNEYPQNPPFTVAWGGKNYNGYWSLCAAINKALEKGIPIVNPKYLASITKENLSEIFYSETQTPIPLFEERIRVLREAGTVLEEKFGGSFKNCILQANKSAQKLIEIVVNNFSSYNDEAEFMGRKVKIYKRAQILIADLWACFEGKGLGEFHDIDTITMFADYRVPQALVFMEVLKYSDYLLEKLHKGDLFPSRDPLEVEIRGNSIWGVELVRREMEKQRKESGLKLPEQPLNAIVIDFYLWTYAKANSEQMKHIPIHKTKSVFY